MQEEKGKNNDIEEDKKPKELFKSKWANLKTLLQYKASIDSSVKILKKQTIEQFSTKINDIYKDKIEIFLLTQRNKRILLSFEENYDSKITIKPASEIIGIDNNTSIQDFLFHFRENNQDMLKIINFLNEERRNYFIPFLCHLFYENIFMESSEQEEIIYIIYLLLEKEIDRLSLPTPESFLTNSFLNDFLIELGHKYEIENYLDIVFNSLIRKLEELYPFYYSMDIINMSKIDYINYTRLAIDTIFFDMNKQTFIVNELFISKASKVENSIEGEDKSKSMIQKKNLKINNLTLSIKIKKDEKKEKIEKKKKILKYESKSIDQFLDQRFFTLITENSLTIILNNEKDEFMRYFYMKQLKIIKSNKNPNIFNCNDYYFKKMVKTKYISKKSIYYYNEGYKKTTLFINKLLKNLEVNNGIPYYIKVICKIIYNLVQKKFKNIPEIKIVNLICRFFFDKLIIPILDNPDGSNTSKNMMISLETRKNLSQIAIVLTKLIRGELFYEEKYDNYKIFNQFIIDNYKRIHKIVLNFIDVKLPNKIMLLLDKFYNSEDFSLENIERKPSEINYDYFEENPNDFMQHDSICFSGKHLFLLYTIVLSKKELFIKDKDFEKIFNEVSNYISGINLSKNDNEYYVAIKEHFRDNKRELLYHKEKFIGVSKAKNPNELLYQLKFSITYLLSKIDVFSYWSWVKEDYDTKKTFDFINKYLIANQRKKILPLNWYSRFILNNLELIDKKYIENDYSLLYEEIKGDVNNLIELLKQINEFLTVNITTKFFLIEKKKKYFKQELENIKKTELNIKTLLFIEKEKIKVCLMNGENYNKIQKELFFTKEEISKNMIIISNKDCCPHKKLGFEEYQKLKKSGELLKYHCNNIKQFTHNFRKLHKYITDEIMNNSFDIEMKMTSTSSFNIKNNNDLNDDKGCASKSPKEILNFYMEFLSKIIKNSSMFNYSNKDLKSLENEKKNIIKIIWNYILKSLCVKIYNFSPLNMDQDFTIRCKLYNQLVKPSFLNICDKLSDIHILQPVKYHIEKMEEKRTPDGMNQEFGKAVELIVSLYKFFYNQIEVEPGDLLPIIIYSILLIEPKRMIFNVNFTQFFLSANELLGDIGYNMTQADSAINYIKNLSPSQLGISGEEFNKAALKIKK